MPLSSIGDGGVHKGGGVLCHCGAYNGSNPSLFGETFRGPAYFITRADIFLRVGHPVRLWLPSADAPLY